MVLQQALTRQILETVTIDFNAIVYATTLAYGADLLSCDAHFEGLPDVVFFRKA